MPGPKLTDPNQIEAAVARARPSRGGRIPADLADRLGASHVAGQYHLTDEPFLLEGANALHGLGFNVLKIWLDRKMDGYRFNSRWDLPPSARLVDVIRHDYLQRTLALPFTTFIFEIAPIDHGPEVKNGQPRPPEDFAADREQLQELVEHILATFYNRNVTFILQHWEGDWMLRGKDRPDWLKSPPSDADARCQAFANWLSMRQAGVTAARQRAAGAKCRVLHAAEVNRVMDGLKGAVTMTTHVLPRVMLDAVSWSSYDGMSSAVNAWQGLEAIRHYSQADFVYLGEVGLPENLGKPPAEIEDYWDRTMGVCFALNVPRIVHWELYCNEPKQGPRDQTRNKTADELRGFWLLRPDGSRSIACEYFQRLLHNAGGRL